MKKEETLKEIGKVLQESVKCSNVVILNLQKLNKKEINMKNSLWTKWGYEDKDLSDIPNAVGGGGLSLS